MKKIATLLLAAGLVFGAATGVSAIDFKAKGQWIMSFDYGQNHAFTGGNGRTGNGNGEDEFEARQRVRLQLDAVASEALSGTVFFEIGDQLWGRANGIANRGAGGALGADGVAVEVKRAYIDWIVPETDLKVRMGIQGIALPSFTTGTQVLDDDMAGISLNYQFNENVGLTAFWARLYNDNGSYTTASGRTYNNYMDNLDAFALLLPLSFDGVKVTPWAMYAAIGPNTFRGTNPVAGNTNWSNFAGLGGFVRAGMLPVNGSMRKDGSFAGKRWNMYGDAFWAGLTGEVTAFDPFRIAWDVNYGDVRYDDSRSRRHGWLASLLFEYKLDWGIPGIYGWYATGDDNNPANGSERMPTLSANGTNGFSNFAFSGNPYIARDTVLGRTMVGTWGVGARLKDMSFLEDLKHTFRINLIGGTNSRGMAKYISAGGTRNGGWNTLTGANSPGVGMDPLYMTTGDTALEFGLTNTYQMYENFTVMLDANYIATWLDKSRNVWGRSTLNGRSDQVRDPWNVNLSFVYSF